MQLLKFCFVLAFLSIFLRGRCETILTNDTVNQNGKIKVMHIGWADGHVPEFGSAYTLHAHEVRLNILGRSSYAMSDKVETSIYLPLIITPNISFKYRFVDTKFFASALEVGTAVGIFPVAAASGILLPGGAVGGGTIGLIHGSDSQIKLYLSFPVSKKLTFSFRGDASTMRVHFTGVVGMAGLGGNGAFVGFLPVDVGTPRFKYFSTGFETDYVINKQNAIVFNTGVGGFKEGKRQLGMATLSWTHAKMYFHYSFGLYGFYDPPKYEMVHESKLPVSAFANVYWILHTGKTIKWGS